MIYFILNKDQIIEKMYCHQNSKKAVKEFYYPLSNTAEMFKEQKETKQGEIKIHKYMVHLPFQCDDRRLTMSLPA